jgi:hypothetical protein
MRLRYKEGTQIADHVNEFQGIINRLSSMGITFEDEVRALLLLGSLPDTWETFKITVCNSAPNGVVTWNLVKIRVLNEESKKIADKDGSSSHSEVLVTQSRGRSKSRGPGKGERSRSKSKGKYANFVCHHCHEKGHIKWHCEQWKKDKKKKKKQVQKQIDSHSDSEGGRISTVEEIMSLIYEEHDG